ncbi:MAG: hypothetical protein ACIAXF_10405 [Phycisphaerales bacterium JB063]
MSSATWRSTNPTGQPTMRLHRLLAVLPLVVAAVWLSACAATPRAATPAPVTASPDGRLALAAPMGHAHNDYDHPVPLLTALDAGMLSIEADVFLRDGTLYVAHDEEDIQPDRTLQALYLDPLWQRFQERGGTQPGHPFGGAVRDSGVPVLLMVDLKDRGHDAWLALESLLAQYPGLARHVKHPADEHETQHSEGMPPPTLTPGPVLAVVSGDRPIDAIARARSRYCGYDGRWPDDAGSAAKAHLMPMVSMSARTLLDLAEPTDDPEHTIDTTLRALSQDAATHGRLARIWATPDDPNTWQRLHNAGLQLINTDTPGGLAEWLQTQAGPDALDAQPFKR